METLVVVQGSKQTRKQKKNCVSTLILYVVLGVEYSLKKKEIYPFSIHFLFLKKYFVKRERRLVKKQPFF